MTIIPHIECTTDTSEGRAKLLEAIGLIDIVSKGSNSIGYKYDFKFPDGTPVNNAAISDSDSSYFIMYDLEAHIIIMKESDEASLRPSPDKGVLYYFALCVLPTTSEDVIDLRVLVPSGATTLKDVFNIMAWPNYSDTVNPNSCTLLPAYVGVPKGMFELANCYVTLNATYTIGTKFVDETGAKWVSLGGPLLYKVPTTD